MRNVALYCGSSLGHRPEYAAAAVEVGAYLARQNIGLVYGGGHVGLMGVAADAALQAGGRVIGVIPETLVRWEVAHHGLSELHVVATMHERKALMADLADAFIALPGGFGTFDELFEVLTWAQLGIHQKPIGLFNVAGYFDALLTALDHAVSEGFVRQGQRDNLLAASDWATLWQRVRGYSAERASISLDPRAR